MQAPAQRRPAGYQTAGVRVFRRVENLLRRAFFHNFPLKHDRHAVADFRNNAQVVADKQHGKTRSLLQFAHQVEDGFLHRHVQRCGRLVGNQDLRIAGHGHRDHHALFLSAADLVGIGVENTGGIG